MSRPLLGTSASEIGIDREDREPIQAQIARQIRSLVLSGRLKPQTRLPSTRALVRRTASRAPPWSRLMSSSRARAISKRARARARGWRRSCRKRSSPRPRSRSPKRPARAGQKREPARPFRSGLVDWENFPHDEWGRLLGRFWRNPPVTLLEHNDPFGWLPLREAIAQAPL
jgi:GntR family transcriptional regulator / MocR family aminotransferase